MKERLNYYEIWYRNGGLLDYEKVFQYNSEKDVLANLAIQLLEPILRGYSRNTLKVLDIGCGTGKFTILLLSRMNSIRPEMTFNVDLVDSSTEALNKFQKRAKPHLVIQIGEKYPMTWRRFRQKALAKKETLKYDFINADHSLYAEPIRKENFMPIFSLMQPGGILFITLESKQSPLRKMKESLGVLINCSEYLLDLLDSESIKYKKVSYESKLYYSYDPVFIRWFFMIPSNEEESDDWKQYWDILEENSIDNGTSYRGCSKYISDVGDIILVTGEEYHGQ